MKEENKKILIEVGVVSIFLLAIFGVWRMNSILKWIELNFDKFFEPYFNMGNIFYVVISLFVIAYVFLMFGMPWNWFRKDNENDTTVR